MTHTPHELAEEFPDKVRLIHHLKTSDTHFAKLCDRYHAVNNTIHRAETNIEPMSDVGELDLRKTRIRLKDQIAAMLN